MVKLADEDMPDVIKDLQKAIHVQAKPHDEAGWCNIFNQAGFESLDVATGPMSLMNPLGMIRDEGLGRTIKIFFQAMKKENRVYFKSMYRFFKTNKSNLGYIAIAAKK